MQSIEMTEKHVFSLFLFWELSIESNKRTTFSVTHQLKKKTNYSKNHVAMVRATTTTTKKGINLNTIEYHAKYTCYYKFIETNISK